ncbi:MAG: PKD domain-containing protein, partial [Spartobacteria bacterium]|nr:PKD domain-containing protein [Spartobacteria bacterium]
MLKAATWLCLAGWMAGVATGWGAVRYVAPSGGHVSPFVSWGTAATTIQAAVDAAVSGDTILVSNGVYDTGGRVISGSLTNRVAINKAVTVRSVNGPEVTCIEGRACPTGTVGYGDAAVRCVYLANNAVLDGFTLSNGHTLAKGSYPDDQNSGGGVYAAYASPPNAVVSNCVITGCSAYMAGGGISGGKIVASVVMYNVAEEAGGGAEECHLYNCILHHNLAYGGGGAAYSMLYNCTVTDNVGTNRGGGVSYSTCYNSIMYYNTSAYGANYYYWSYTNCCTTPEPSRGNNIADEPLFVDRANGDYRLMSNSPCINAGLGQAWMAGAGDLDGLPRVVGMSVDIGAYEYQSLTDLLSVEIQASHSQAVVGVAVPFTGVVSGNEQGYVWRMGDGHTHYNVGDVSNVYAAAGSYEVTLTASNLAGAVTATVTVEIVAAGYSYYVAPSGDDAAAGTAWTNAKATLQAGVDAAGLGCVVWVSNGLYNTGGRVCGAGLTNRVTIDKRLMVRSVNGPDATCIAGAADPLTSSNGDAAVRCVYLADEVVLDGFTLSNGYTRMTGDGNLDQSGGGAYCFSTSALITNCVFTHNSAQRNAGACCRGTLDHCWLTDNRAVSYGGGTYVSVHRYCLIENNMARDGAGIANGPAYNCVIRGNIAERNGGGLYASSAHAHNCTVVGNTAGDKGGGAYRINAENCILYYNQAASSDNFYEGNFTNSCAWPAAAGLNNITNAPLLVSMADARLLPDSPCIDRGMNEGWMAGLPDWYGHDRIVNGVVDIGAAEFFGSSALTGALSAVICAGYTQAPVGISVPFVAEIEGAAQGYIWSMGDGTAITNECAFAHAYGAPGYLDVTLTVSNLTDRITVTQQVAILLEDCDYYVRPDGDDGADGTTWATAKATIQAAVDTADMGCVIWVSNGLYAAGGVALHAGLTNRVTVDRLVTVRSVNGPAVTTIAGQECATNGACGDGAVRCVYLADGAALIGFTLTNGHTLALGTEQRQGGGVWCAGSGAVISNCVISGCRAADYGGGCRGGALYDTLLRGNRARYGGGVSEAVLYACVISNNMASRGGG